MYEFIKVGEANREAYDQAVASQPQTHVFQSYEWGEIKAWSGWIAHRFIIKRDGVEAGGFQLLERPIKPLRRCIFYVPCGPAADLADPELVTAFAAKVRELARERRAIFVKLDPPWEDARADVKRALEAAGFRAAAEGDGGFEGIQPRCVMHLDISGTEDEILGRMTEKWRYNIRLAARKGVVVRLGQTAEDIEAFYRILEVTGKRDDFLIRSVGYFKKMSEEMAGRDMFRLFMADYEGQPISATIALGFADKCWYVYGASGNEHRNVMPNHALQWAMIKWAHERGCPVYDFRGVPCDLSPDHPLHGLVRFKTGFGAYPVTYIGEYQAVYQPMFAWLHDYGMPVYTRLRKLLRR
jgi:peptidoglycan pentaglycine glycine transferase (the first glycine)